MKRRALTPLRIEALIDAFRQMADETAQLALSEADDALAHERNGEARALRLAAWTLDTLTQPGDE